MAIISQIQITRVLQVNPLEKVGVIPQSQRIMVQKNHKAFH